MVLLHGLAGCSDIGPDSSRDALVEFAVLPSLGSASDALELSNGRVILNDTELPLVDDGRRRSGELVGLRFEAVPLPPGAQVVAAHVQFHAASSNDGTAEFVVQAEASDDAPPLTERRFDLSSRSRSTAQATWSPPAWTQGSATAAEQTVDLRNVLSEIAARPGWSQDGSIVLLFSGAGLRVATSFDGDPAMAPRLHLEWTDGSGTDAGSAGDSGAGDSGQDTGTTDSGSGDSAAGDAGTDGGSCATVVVEQRVHSSENDMEERSGGSVIATSSDLELVDDGSSNTGQTVAMRFESLGIPSGSIVETAYVQFTVDEVDTGATVVDIQLENSDDAGPLVATDHNLSTRPRTTASVQWQPAAWTDVGAAGADQRTPDLSGVLSEVVGRSGWSTASSAVVLITGNGERTAEAYDGSPTDAPLLHVEYTPPQCGSNPSCGDGICNGSEDCTSCSQDCGACPPGCGDGVCDASESCSSCASDCGACPPSCGDGVCDGSESCSSCASDCGACPPSCGDGVCNSGEDCTSCSSDCGVCPGTTTHYVAVNGSSSGDGSVNSPWDLDTALSGAGGDIAPGDVVYLRGGTYYGRVNATASGATGAPITFRSHPGESATIDSGFSEFRTPGNQDWELVNASIGEYRSIRPCSSSRIFAYVDGISGYENERVFLIPYRDAAAFRATTDQYEDSSTPFYVGPGVYRDSSTGRCHIRLEKTDDMRNVEARYGQVFPVDRPDPRDYAIIASEASVTLEVDGAHLVFQQLTINQATRTIRLDPGSHHITFDGVTAWLGAHALDADGAIHDVHITQSRFLGDNPQWIFWSDMKDEPYPADAARQTTISMRGGAHDWEISYSLIRGSGQDLVGVNEDEDNLVVHHSRLENCGDDAFELEGTVDIGRVEIYENHISNCLLSVAPGQDSAAMTGPLLVYRNTMSFLRNPPINRAPGINSWNGGGRYGFHYLFKHGSGSSYATRNTHYYHNTIIMLNSNSGLNMTPKFPDGSTVANNILIMINDEIHRSYRLGSSQVIDGNLYWKVNTDNSAPLADGYDTVNELNAALGIEANGIGDTPRQGTDPQLPQLSLNFVSMSGEEWALNAASEIQARANFLLSSMSPAIGAGVALPAGLPDSRASNDIGAIPSTASAADYSHFPFVP